MQFPLIVLQLLTLTVSHQQESCGGIKSQVHLRINQDIFWLHSEKCQRYFCALGTAPSFKDPKLFLHVIFLNLLGERQATSVCVLANTKIFLSTETSGAFHFTASLMFFLEKINSHI